MLAVIGAGLSLWWLILLARQWSEDGDFPIDGGEHFGIGLFGVLVFALAWLWSLATSLAVLHAARRPR